MAKAKGAEAPTDWEAIEREFRAGQISVREIGRTYGVSDMAIRKRAKAENWERGDLAEKVSQRVRNELVRGEVRSPNAREPINDAVAVEVAAARAVEVIRQHQKRLSTLNDLSDRLARRADALIESVTTLEDLGDAAQAVESLGRTTGRLIPLERQVFNLDAPEDKTVNDRADDARAEMERRLSRIASGLGAKSVS